MLAPVPDRPDGPLTPVVDRVEGPQVVVYLELYAERGDTLRDADVRVEITGPDADAPRVSRPAEITRRDARLAVARVVVPLGGSPGAYLVRAFVTAGGRSVRVERPFLFIGR
jgi:hypothetical protein